MAKNPLVKTAPQTPAPSGGSGGGGGGGRFDGLRMAIDGLKAAFGMAPAKDFTVREKAVAMGTFGAMASVESDMIVTFDTAAGQAIQAAKEATLQANHAASQATEQARIGSQQAVDQARIAAGQASAQVPAKP